MAERVCPHCGSDTWKAANYDRMVVDNRRLSNKAEKLAAENGVLRYQAEMVALEWRDRLARFQRKITRQRAAINRLTERIGDKPFAGFGPGETPGPTKAPEIRSTMDS